MPEVIDGQYIFRTKTSQENTLSCRRLVLPSEQVEDLQTKDLKKCHAKTFHLLLGGSLSNLNNNNKNFISQEP